MNAGKGDRPRNNWSKKFRNNFDQIDWKNASRDKIKKANKDFINDFKFPPTSGNV